MKHLVYVVRTMEDVEVLEVKPNDVHFLPGKREWFTRDKQLRFSVGESDSSQLLYTDDPWIVPIGVYDLSRPKHVLEMIAQVKAHLNNIKYRKVLGAVGEVVELKIRTPRIGHSLITADPFIESDTPLGDAIKKGFNAPDCFHM